MSSQHEALQGFSQQLACMIQQQPGRGKKRAFAQKIGVKPQQLSRYLKGQIPDASTLLTITAVGQVSVDWLLTGREVQGRNEAAAQPSPQAILRRLAQIPTPVLLVFLRVIEELEALGILDTL